MPTIRSLNLGHFKWQTEAVMDEISIGIWKDEIGLVNRSTRKVKIRMTDSAYGKDEYDIPMEPRSYANFKRKERMIEEDGWLDEE